MNATSSLENYSDETLYRDYFTPIYRFLFFRTKDYDVAIDLTQTAFLKFMSNTTKPADGEYAIKLLFTIARNTLIDYWRSSHVRLSETSSWLDLKSADVISVEEDIERKEMSLFIDKLISNLNDREQEVVSLRATSDLSYESIAEITQTSPENCRQIYSRAIKNIKKQIISNGNFK